MDQRHLLSGIWHWALVMLAFAFLRCEPAGASFIVFSWGLHTEIEDFHSGQFQYQDYYTIQNPLLLSQSVAIPPTPPSPSTGTTEYDFGWDDFNGSFHVGASHAALDVPPGGLFSRSTGFITIQTTQPLLVSVTGFYNYALPPNLFAADLRASVRNTNTAQLLWGQDPTANSFGGSFVSGTLHVDTPAGGVLVPGGATYTISYTMMLRTFGGGTNAIGTGNGEIQWDIQVVPECTALSLLAPAFLFMARRRRSTGI